MTSRQAKIMKLKAELKQTVMEFREAVKDFDDKFTEFQTGLIPEREVEFYAGYAYDLQDDAEMLKRKIKRLVRAELKAKNNFHTA